MAISKYVEPFDRLEKFYIKHLVGIRNIEQYNSNAKNNGRTILVSIGRICLLLTAVRFGISASTAKVVFSDLINAILMRIKL